MKRFITSCYNTRSKKARIMTPSLSPSTDIIVSATHLHNYMIDDCLVDWLKSRSRPGTSKSPMYGHKNNFTEFIMNKGIEFEKELNIKIIRIRGPFYCSKCEKITTDKECQHIKNRIPVSGTNIRDALINKKTISEKFMRKEIVESIKGKEIFIE